MATSSPPDDDVVEGWKSYFAYVKSLLDESERHRETDSTDKAIYFSETFERYTQSTDRLLATVKDALNFPTDYAGVSECTELELLLERLVHVLRYFVAAVLAFPCGGTRVAESVLFWSEGARRPSASDAYRYL